MGRRWHQLHEAAQSGSISRVVNLASTGSIDVKGGPSGLTPLMIAARAGHAHVAKILLAEGADVSALSDSGSSALTLAVDSGHIAATQLLLDAGADPETKTTLGHTLLHVAIDRGHSCVTKLLIDAGANVNNRTPYGETALYLAAAGGHVQIVVELLRGNADLLPTTGGFTPMEVAAGKGYSRVVFELVQRVGLGGCGGASRGVDALTYAAQKQHVATMAVLTGAGVVDTGAAITTAVKHRSERSVSFLLRQQEEENISPYLKSANPPLLLGCILSVVGPETRHRLEAAPRIARMLVDAGEAPTAPLQIAHPDRDHEETVISTPVHLVTDWILEKKIAETTLSEEQLNALQAIRRLLLQEEAVHAVSWLWPIDVSVGSSEGARKTTPTSKTLASTIPILRRRSAVQARGLVFGALLRQSNKP